MIAMKLTGGLLLLAGMLGMAFGSVPLESETVVIPVWASLASFGLGGTTLLIAFQDQLTRRRVD